MFCQDKLRTHRRQSRATEFNFSWLFLRDDIASIGISYLDNILLENLGAGISHEIGYDTVIAGNWAAGNGRAFQVRSILQKLNVQTLRRMISN